MTTRQFTFVALLVLSSLLLASCSPAPAAPRPVEVIRTVVSVQTVEVLGQGQTIVVTNTPAPSTARPVLRTLPGPYPSLMDPQKTADASDLAHLNLIYEGLTRLNQRLETAPAAAERWEYNADMSGITFTLRKGLKYSDGTPLNAKRFAYALLRNMDPETAGEYAHITDDIAGAAEWRYADPSAPGYDAQALKAAVKVQALDSAGQPCTDYQQEDCRTLQIGLARPVPYFHTLMSLWATYPVKEENLTAGGENWSNSSKYQTGNGPFILKRFEPFQRAYFVPNPHYWRGQPSYDVEYSYVEDNPMYFEAYKNNEFDIIPLISEDLAALRANPGLSQEFHSYPGTCTTALMFNQLREPFNDPKVRQAFSYALDREAYARDVRKGAMTPTLTWIPPGFPGYREGETRFAFDVDKARQALAESTYGSAEALPEVVATFVATPVNRPHWEWLAIKWKEALGVEVRLEPVEPRVIGALAEDIKTAPQMTMRGWCADYPDPQTFLSAYWRTGAFAKRIGFSNPQMDALMDAADIETDPARRLALYQQAQDILVDSAAVIFLGNSANYYLVKPWVKGALPSAFDFGWMGSLDPLTITIEGQEQ